MITLPVNFHDNFFLQRLESGIKKSRFVNISLQYDEFVNAIIFSNDKKEIIHCPVNFIGNFVIPEGVESIGVEAFEGCKKLYEISIPKSVRYIKTLAFANCCSLRKVTIHNQRPINISEDAFDKMQLDSCTLIVPNNSIADYLNTDKWREFKNIKEKVRNQSISNFKTLVSKQII